MLVSQAQIGSLDFAKSGGLLPAIVQDADSGAVLMLGYMDRAALGATLERGRVVFFSRERQRLWEKGESSGHYLELVEIRADCDADALLVTARPQGPVCHTGTRTCFGDAPVAAAERLGFLVALERIIEQRIAHKPEGSYTARLYSQGAKRLAQKIGEEGVELALAGAAEGDDKVIAEAADLLFHVLLLLKSRNVGFERVVEELRSRHTARR
jgi:phosphoribosyl-ATP pyrophosphohydrolase/phosphoribosyl-AMP cyclohydrolase